MILNVNFNFKQIAVHGYNFQIKVHFTKLNVDLSLDCLFLVAITFTQMALQITFYG